MSKNNIKAISLFCGCGGADLGLIGGFTYLNKKYNETGIDIYHASDIDCKAVETYNLNFNNKAIAEDVNNLIFKRGSADLIIGGFPCQSFSSVNPSKNPDNKERQLFWQMADIIDMVRPSTFIAENVKGFYRLSKGQYFQMAKTAFESLGYIVNEELLDASNYGVPQRRERLLIVGVRKQLNKSYEYPKSTHGPISNSGKLKTPLSKVIKSLTPPHPKYYFSQRAVDGVKKAKPNMKRALAQDLNGQCLTITSHLAKVSLNSRDPVLMVSSRKELYRRFTPREAARIQSFPDTFQFAGSEADAYRQIGNAVPPVLMWHVAREVVNQIY